MEIFLIIFAAVSAVFATYSIVERYRRHRRGIHQSGDTTDAVLDGAILAMALDDLTD
jgi:hypothetical protein